MLKFEIFKLICIYLSSSQITIDNLYRYRDQLLQPVGITILSINTPKVE